jgi:hypothetical protein
MRALPPNLEERKKVPEENARHLMDFVHLGYSSGPLPMMYGDFHQRITAHVAPGGALSNQLNHRLTVRAVAFGNASKNNWTAARR